MPSISKSTLIVMMTIVFFFTGSLLVGIVFMPRGAQRDDMWKIVGFGVLILGQLSMMIRAEQTVRTVAQTKEEVKEVKDKVDTNISAAIRTAAHEIRTSEKSQVTDGTAFPTTMAELNRVIEAAAAAAAERICKEMHDEQARNKSGDSATGPDSQG